MILNVEKYIKKLEGFDLTHKQKEEMLRALWRMMEAVIDKAYNMHPVQQALSTKHRNKRSKRLASVAL